MLPPPAQLPAMRSARKDDPMPGTAVMLLTCPDRPGVVAAVANFIAAHGGNIVHAEQHTDAV